MRTDADPIPSAARLVLPRVGLDGPLLRSLLRAVLVVGFVALLASCVATAWSVLGELSRVKLAHCSRALEVVSVRDAVLCGLGYVVGKALLRAVVRVSRSS
jgi:hypothetical protein